MPKYVAVIGGGIAGLCLAASLIQLNYTAESEIHVDLYEASQEFVEVGAGVTLWGRVCEILRLMGMEEDCVRASVVAARKHGEGATDGFQLRGFRDDADYGKLPVQDAWSLYRADLMNIFARRVPSMHTHLGKRLVAYHDPSFPDPITLTFADGTTATCDVLVGADGLRSVVRAQMVRDVSHNSNSHSAPSHADLTSHINPRWSGTIAYRALVPAEALHARDPAHSLLKGGVMYFGKNQHVVGYPISPTTVNLVISITNLADVDTEWPPRSSSSTCSPAGQSQSQLRPSRPLPSPPSPATTRERTAGSRLLDHASFEREIAPMFDGWGSEVEDIIKSIDTCMEWPMMDLDPLPFYTWGRTVLMGDAAHAAVPYLGAGAALAIEDAYILSHLLHAAAPPTVQSSHNPSPIVRALETFQHLRLPRGNALVRSGRLVLRSYQFNGPYGDDMHGATEVICKAFEETAGVGGAEDTEGGRGPEEDKKWGVARVKEML